MIRLRREGEREREKEREKERERERETQERDMGRKTEIDRKGKKRESYRDR